MEFAAHQPTVNVILELVTDYSFIGTISSLHMFKDAIEYVILITRMYNSF